MSGQIRMTPSELHSKSKRYGESAEQINDVLSRLKSLQDDLRGEWEGQAFERFDDQFEQLRPKVNEFEELLRKIQEQLEKTADAVQDQDESLAQNFGLS